MREERSGKGSKGKNGTRVCVCVCYFGDNREPTKTKRFQNASSHTLSVPVPQISFPKSSSSEESALKRSIAQRLISAVIRASRGVVAHTKNEGGTHTRQAVRRGDHRCWHTLERNRTQRGTKATRRDQRSAAKATHTSIVTECCTKQHTRQRKRAVMMP